MTAGDRRTDFTMACTVKVLDHVIFFHNFKIVFVYSKLCSSAEQSVCC